MAQYIDETYVEAHLGSGYVNAVQAISGVYLSTLITAGTARVQSALKAAGYSTPDTTADEVVKLAVLGCVREMVADVPEAAQQLPDDWAQRAQNPVRILREIVNGDVPSLASHSLDTSTAVGGSQFSISTASGLPKRTTKRELGGY